MQQAKWWITTDNDRIKCTLCPRYCELSIGQEGFCYIRQNINGKLYSIGYGHPTGFSVDPIEKKPLNHFLPGSGILSFGTAGCNLGCKYCQNWTMTKARFNEISSLNVTPEDVIRLAKNHNTPSIAYTYNEPTIFGEFVMDVSKLAREENIKNVMVTAGYITPEARKDVYKNIDAANVDLKAFNELFYYKLTYSHLDPVLDTLRYIKDETNIWLEITNLLIPDENDSAEEIKRMCDWILNNLGDSIPLHFSAFHPDYKMTNKKSTSAKTLITAKNIANQTGIQYVYIGNIYNKDGQSTFCPNCNAKLIERDWYRIISNRLNQNKCYNCNYTINGIF